MSPVPFRLALRVTAAALLTACGQGTTETDGATPRTITAAVLGVGEYRGSTLLVVDTTGRFDRSGDLTGRLILRVAPETPVFVRAADGALRPATAAAALGTSVRAWLTGADLSVSPRQYPVSRLEVTTAAP